MDLRERFYGYAGLGASVSAQEVAGQGDPPRAALLFRRGSWGTGPGGGGIFRALAYGREAFRFWGAGEGGQDTVPLDVGGEDPQDGGAFHRGKTGDWHPPTFPSHAE